MKTLPASPSPAVESVADVLERSYRRLCYQRVELGDGPPRVTLIGIRHRLPVACSVSPRVAEALRRRGLPTVVHVERAGGGDAWSSATATR